MEKTMEHEIETAFAVVGATIITNPMLRAISGFRFQGCRVLRYFILRLNKESGPTILQVFMPLQHTNSIRLKVKSFGSE